MSFCCIVDSANQMYLRVIAQPCALGLQDVGERSWTRGVFDSNKAWLNTEMLFLTPPRGEGERIGDIRLEPLVNALQFQPGMQS